MPLHAVHKIIFDVFGAGASGGFQISRAMVALFIAMTFNTNSYVRIQPY